MATCLYPDCEKPSRARGYCDTHYRRIRSDSDAGRPSMDGTVWKVRVVKKGRGSQPYYFSDRDQAYRRARAAEKAGELLFFAEYSLKEKFT